MIFRILEDQYAEKSKLSKAADQRFMPLALSLGRRGQGRTWPNPAGGAGVVKDGVIVGRGWTQPGGRPHAEPEALGRAGEAARGATLYVTLEPCSHFGKRLVLLCQLVFIETSLHQGLQWTHVQLESHWAAHLHGEGGIDESTCR